MLKFFDWNIWAPTSADFFEYFIEFIADDDDLNTNYSQSFACLRDLKQMLAQKAFQYLDSTLNSRTPQFLTCI